MAVGVFAEVNGAVDILAAAPWSDHAPRALAVAPEAAVHSGAAVQPVPAAARPPRRTWRGLPATAGRHSRPQTG